MEKRDWIWLPHPAHFICAQWCQFRMATVVGHYVVSTVGEYIPDSAVMKIKAEIRGNPLKEIGDPGRVEYLNKFGYEEIGPDSLYETMVFPAVPRNEPDTCCAFKAYIEAGEQDWGRYNTPAEALEGHTRLCYKWAEMPPWKPVPPEEDLG